MQIKSKALSAIAAAAVIAGAITVLTEASGSVSANAPLDNGKTDRLEISASGAANCAAQTWPNLDAACLKDRRQPLSAAKPVRIITSADNLHRANGPELATANAIARSATAAHTKTAGRKAR
jgi:hypothetical protein